MAHLRDGGWGPTPEHRDQAAAWADLQRWAGARQGPTGCPRPERALLRLRGRLAADAGDRRSLRAAAGAVYQGAWLASHEERFWQWVGYRADRGTWREPTMAELELLRG